MAKGSAAPKNTQIALFQQVEVPEPFKKAVQAIHVSPVGGALTLQQRRLFNSLIKNAIEHRLERNDGANTFQISIPEMMAELSLTTKDTGYIKETAKSLMRTVVDWDQLNSDGTATWTGSTLVAGAKITGAILSYSFAPQICEELLNPERYAMIDMRIAKLFRRAHALALWENTVRYERIGITAKIPLTVFRNLILGREEGETKYKEYKIFKRAVLLPCIAEINTVSDHTIELIEHKVGRTVAELQFRIARKEAAEKPDEEDFELIQSVVKLGVPLSEARKAVRSFGAERVRQAVAYTKARLGKKNAPAVDNVAAYFRKAVTENWAKGREAEEPPEEAPRVSRPVSARTPAEAKDQYVAARINEVQGYFGELDPEEQTAAIGRYNDQCTVPSQRVVTGKKPSKAAQAAFYQWLALETWGEPSADDLLRFILSGQV
ncbi:RepB family plasmid replication initiator protein (plasmid) [Cupriavidus malaysiensis]|uniref:RepB family plasmid replication initiator protein n=2 Tax=Cupriavidus malaysiensis TaxID=367825 RepID=A0ABM6FGZ6_9BURK|nr:RepB family plasmid replication initiator protein [Cupriavidus malaysiensis]AOZ11222.1 RepB family plasmid replication initiator protein [Cupriavidus malaysiensis]